MWKGRSVAGLGLVAGLAVSLLAPAAARAGTYQVAVCHDPDSLQAAPLDGLSFPNSGQYVDSGVYGASAGACALGGYVYATLDGITAHGPTDAAAWEFMAPPATQIASAEVYRYLYAGASAPYQSPVDTIQVVSGNGAATAVAACSQALGCTSVGTSPLEQSLYPYNVFDQVDQLPLSGLNGIVAIEGIASCGGGGICAAGGSAVCPEIGGDPCMAANHLFALVVTLTDNSAPTIGNVTGTLVGPGVLTGTVGITFDASDTGSGLYSAGLIVDGLPILTTSMGRNGGRCVPYSDTQPGAPLRFGWEVPCALAASASIALDTTRLKDGPHTVSVTATDAAGNTGIAWSGTIDTGNAPHGGSPQLSGAAQVGHTLTASSGEWSPAATGYSYQWLRCDAAGGGCTAIAGATSPSYTLASADAYHQLAVTVNAADADGSTNASSPLSGAVLDANGYVSPPQGPALAGGTQPQINGHARQGARLTVRPGTWSAGPVSYAYQWQRCDAAGLGCAAIAHASGSSYTLTSADDYRRLRVLVRASGPGGTSQAASEPSALVADSAGATAAPRGASTAVGAPSSPNGAGACRHPTMHAALGGEGTVTVPLGRRVTLRGSLSCGRAPVAGALVAATVSPLGGLGRAHHAEIRTRSDGSFAYVLGPGPSRRIALRYRAFTGDAKPSAAAGARLLVRPSLSLAITPSSTTNGHTITWTGAVAGGLEPPGGLTLEIEYRQGSRWMIYDTVRARRADGHFSYRYTFRRTTQPITYWFRVAIPAGGVTGYPYLPAASPPRSVHVAP